MADGQDQLQGATVYPRLAGRDNLDINPAENDPSAAAIGVTTSMPVVHESGKIRAFESERTAIPSIRAIFVFALVLATLSASYAIFEARDFDADGPQYLIKATKHGGLYLGEPARMSVQFLQQFFSFIAFRLGGTEPLTYGRLMTLGMQGWPLLLTGLAWFILPRGQKSWILGPLLNIAVVVPTTSFMGIGEGIIASCLMWLLYFLVEFRMKSGFTGIIAVALAVSCFSLHEAAFPFMLGISILSFSRARTAHGIPFLCSVLVGIAALASSIHLFYFVVFPRDSFERGAFLIGLLAEFLVTPQGPGFNLPTVAALLVGVCLLLVHFPRHLSDEKRQRRVIAACKLSSAIFALIAVLFLVLPEWVIIPHAYFAARGLPVIATTLMAGMIHFMLRAGWTADRLVPTPIRIVLIALVSLQLLVQTVMTQHWASYRRDLADLVATHRGVIDWNTASEALNPHQTFFRRHLIRAWSVQPLSIVLAPHGHVLSLVDARPGIMWRAFDPLDPKRLPLCAKGFDWSQYLIAIGEAGVDPKTICAQSPGVIPGISDWISNKT